MLFGVYLGVIFAFLNEGGRAPCRLLRISGAEALGGTEILQTKNNVFFDFLISFHMIKFISQRNRIDSFSIKNKKPRNTKNSIHKF